MINGYIVMVSDSWLRMINGSGADLDYIKRPFMINCWDLTINNGDVVNPTMNHPQYYQKWVVKSIPIHAGGDGDYGIGFTMSTLD